MTVVLNKENRLIQRVLTSKFTRIKNKIHLNLEVFIVPRSKTVNWHNSA